jgi:hypothetical protein
MFGSCEVLLADESGTHVRRQITPTEYQLVRAMNLTLKTTYTYDEIRTVVQQATEMQAAKGGRRMLEVSDHPRTCGFQ